MSKFIRYKNIEVHFDDVGQGKVVVLLHGFLENRSMWKHLSAQLMKTHRVIRIDLLGHGKTDSLGYIHTMEMMADSVYAVLKTLDIEQCILIGHSMGGYVALAFAEAHSNFLKGLCLMNSTAQEDSVDRKLLRDRAIHVVKQNPSLFIQTSIPNLFAHENQKKFSQEIDKLIQDALQTTPQGIISALEGMKVRKNRVPIFESIPCKKLLIVGKHDHILDYQALLLQTDKTAIEVVEFEGGHMSHIENKEELSYNIMHFIENI